MRLLFRSILNNKPRNINNLIINLSRCLSNKAFKMSSFSTLFQNNTTKTTNNYNAVNNKYKDKVVVIMGCTGSGKSRLSIDITRHFPSEIINSDKIQFYKGLDITTNKVPEAQQKIFCHHFLAKYDSLSKSGDGQEVSPSQYREKASSVISNIHSRDKLPLLVGGSNSYIYALLAKEYNPESDVFSGKDPIMTELKYKCCFLWVDTAEEVLREYLDKRVDEMVESGMVEELWDFYKTGKYDAIKPNMGLRRAIGVPEFEPYFNGRGAYEEFVREVKANTWQLAINQLGKIQRLRNAGWDIHRLDGTDTINSVLQGSNSWAEVWRKQVIEPSMKIVKNFLEE